MTNRIEIEVGGWPDCSGAKATLYLIPGEENGGTPQVYSFGNVGPGVPMPAWNRRHLSLGTVPLDTKPESLRDWLLEQEESLLALSALYLGSEWDGSNEVGRWHEDAQDAAYAFNEELQAALTDEAIECEEPEPEAFEDTSIHAGCREWVDDNGTGWRAERDGDAWKVSERNSGAFVLVAIVSLDPDVTPRELWDAARDLMAESEVGA